MSKLRVCVLICSFLVNSSTGLSGALLEPIDLSYTSLQKVLPLDLHGWFCEANQRNLKYFIEEKKPKVVVEVGVWLGKSAIFMASLLDSDAVLYAVDHWKGQYYWENPGDDILSRLATLYEQFLSNVIHKKLTFIIKPVKTSSLEAAQKLDIVADLIYIDASHTEKDVYDDIVAWHKKLHPKGIMCGDDWWHDGIKRGVRAAANLLGKKICCEENFWFFSFD